MKLPGENKGFTLVETLIVLGIFSVITAAILLFFKVGIEMGGMGAGRTDMQAHMRYAMDTMVRELKNSTRSKNPVEAVNIQTTLDPNDTMVFSLPVIDATTGNITSWRSVTFRREIDPASNIPVLVRGEGAERRILATHVQSVQFVDAGIDPALFLDEVNITLTLEKVTSQNRTLTFTTAATVKLRN